MSTFDGATVTKADLKSVLNGICPECKNNVRDWKPPSGSFAPEAYATLREHDINPSTGHKNGCSYEG